MSTLNTGSNTGPNTGSNTGEPGFDSSLDSAVSAEQQIKRSNLLIDQRRYDQAVEVLVKVLAIAPDCAEAYVDLSLCQYELGDLQQAITYAQLGIALTPQWTYAHFQLARAYYGLRQWRKMKKATQMLLALNPNNPDAYMLEATYWSNLHRPDDMLKSAEQGLRCDPSHLGCQVLQAQTLLRLLRLEGAMASIEAVLQQAPAHAPGYTTRGWIFYRQNKKTLAIEDFQTALRLDPNSAWAKEGLKAALTAKNPLNYFHFVNPYGRSLFSAAQVRSHYWLLAAPLVVIAGVVGLWLTGRGFVFTAMLAGFVLSYLLLSAYQSETCKERGKYLLSAVFTFLSAVLLHLAMVNSGNEALLRAGAITGAAAYALTQDWRA